jgi:hypothetical protein
MTKSKKKECCGSCQNKNDELKSIKKKLVSLEARMKHVEKRSNKVEGCVRECDETSTETHRVDGDPIATLLGDMKAAMERQEKAQRLQWAMDHVESSAFQKLNTELGLNGVTIQPQIIRKILCAFRLDQAASVPCELDVNKDTVSLVDAEEARDALVNVLHYLTGVKPLLAIDGSGGYNLHYNE